LNIIFGGVVIGGTGISLGLRGGGGIKGFGFAVPNDENISVLGGRIRSSFGIRNTAENVAIGNTIFHSQRI